MLTLSQLADFLGGVWHGNANHAIRGLSSLSRATSSDVAYFDNPSLLPSLQATSAAVVLLKAEYLPLCPTNSIVVAHPLDAINKAFKLISSAESPLVEIHHTATIHQSAQLGENISIGPYCFVADNVQLADGVVIGANSCIDSSVVIGKNSKIACGVTIHSGCTLGANVVINSGCVLGATPFNYFKQHGVWRQGPDLGGVVIADGVHVGANTVIDRGALGDTYLADGVCVDNLVQIAHDVCIGSNSAIAGCATIGAHVQIGTDCIIGGGTCLAAFVCLTDDVVITGMSTVSKSIAKSGIYSSGTLVHPHDRWRKNAARFKRLDDYMIKLNTLEKKINNIEVSE